MGVRQLLPGLFAAVITAASMLSGCGGAQNEPRRVVRGSNATPMRKAVEAPKATELKLTACVEAHPGPWAEDYYALVYDLKTNEKGDVLKVTLRDTQLRDTVLEACFKEALMAMEVPAEALRSHSSQPVSGHSRATVGVVQAAAAPIALAPILIPALGVTIIVAISIDIVRKATSEDSERERCRKVNEACQQKCLPKLRHSDFGNQFHRCMRECREAAGCWKAT